MHIIYRCKSLKTLQVYDTKIGNYTPFFYHISKITFKVLVMYNIYTYIILYQVCIYIPGQTI